MSDNGPTTNSELKELKMAKICSSDKRVSATFNAMEEHARRIGEANDCSVKAIATVCGVSYATAREVCAQNGRKSGDGMRTNDMLHAVRSLGFDCKEFSRYGEGCIKSTFISQYPPSHQILKNVTSHHPKRFNKVWADGKSYLFFAKNHVLAVVDGVNHDWTVGRAMQVYLIVEITKRSV
jgi:hypothetical protein